MWISQWKGRRCRKSCISWPNQTLEWEKRHQSLFAIRTEVPVTTWGASHTWLCFLATMMGLEIYCMKGNCSRSISIISCPSWHWVLWALCSMNIENLHRQRTIFTKISRGETIILQIKYLYCMAHNSSCDIIKLHVMYSCSSCNL